MPTSLQNFTLIKFHENMPGAWFSPRKNPCNHVIIGENHAPKQARPINLGDFLLLQKRYNLGFMGCKSSLKPYNKNIVRKFLQGKRR